MSDDPSSDSYLLKSQMIEVFLLAQPALMYLDNAIQLTLRYN
jgi:hypothetical protein